MRQQIQQLTTQIDIKSKQLQHQQQQCRALQWQLMQCINRLCPHPIFLPLLGSAVVGLGLVAAIKIKPVLTPKRVAIRLRIVMFLLMMHENAAGQSKTE